MPGTVRYLLGIPDPHSHMLEVEVRVADPDGPVDLVMPSWTPGSYLLREFPRHVQDFSAATADGIALDWRRTDKNTWRVEPRAGEPVHASYRVYANEPTVRTSHLDATHAYVNGASVFMFVRNSTEQDHRLDIDAPREWTVTTSLEPDGSRAFRAASYHELIDSPIEIGNHEILEWEQHGVPHRYAIWGQGNLDPEKLVEDTRRIIDAEQSLFGGVPYSRYTFILHLVPGGRGGLEHASSCSIQADRWAFEGEAYTEFLALVAHELFHVWNGKRIRPAALDGVDYAAENYTRDLWVVEGLTTYYGDLMLCRAGLISAEKYLERLSTAISRLRTRPGRRHQSLAESSFDTWIRFYRPDENTPNSQVSYYHKGALVGLLLDLEIRRATSNERSLDDVMRLLWERHGSRNIGYPEAGDASFEAIAAEVAGIDLSAFFNAYVRGTDELDYERSLAAAGLYLRSRPATDAPPGDTEVIEARLGLRTREHAGRIDVTTVLAGSTGWGAGIDAHDEIIAFDGFRVTTTKQLAARLRGRPEGDPVTLAIFRRDELLRLTVPLDAAPLPPIQIARMAEAGEMQRAMLGGWLHG